MAFSKIIISLFVVALSLASYNAADADADDNVLTMRTNMNSAQEENAHKELLKAKERYPESQLCGKFAQNYCALSWQYHDCFSMKFLVGADGGYCYHIPESRFKFIELKDGDKVYVLAMREGLFREN